MENSFSAMKKTRYDTVLFDADDTLLDFKRSEISALTDALSKFSLDFDTDVIDAYREINASFWKMLEQGKIEKSKLKYERFRVFCERYGFGVPYAELAECYMKRLSMKSYLIDGAKEICEKLSAHCKLYIITNGVETIQRPRFSASGLQGYFSGSFISDSIGFEKPDVRFFEYVERSIGELDKERTLIVGDSLTSDMQGGKNFGVDTCFFNPKGKELPPELCIKYSINKLSELEDIIFGEC